MQFFLRPSSRKIASFLGIFWLRLGRSSGLRLHCRPDARHSGGDPVTDDLGHAAYRPRFVSSARRCAAARRAIGRIRVGHVSAHEWPAVCSPTDRDCRRRSGTASSCSTRIPMRAANERFCEAWRPTQIRTIERCTRTAGRSAVRCTPAATELARVNVHVAASATRCLPRSIITDESVLYKSAIEFQSRRGPIDTLVLCNPSDPLANLAPLVLQNRRRSAADDQRQGRRRRRCHSPSAQDAGPRTRREFAHSRLADARFPRSAGRIRSPARTSSSRWSRAHRPAMNRIRSRSGVSFMPIPESWR